MASKRDAASRSPSCVPAPCAARTPCWRHKKRLGTSPRLPAPLSIPDGEGPPLHRGCTHGRGLASLRGLVDGGTDRYTQLRSVHGRFEGSSTTSPTSSCARLGIAWNAPSRRAVRLQCLAASARTLASDLLSALLTSWGHRTSFRP